MGVIASDDFNREAGTLGAPWTHVSGGGARITPDGRLRSIQGTQATLHVLPADYPTQYRVQCDLVRLSGSITTFVGVVGRQTGSSANYHVRWYDLAGGWELYRLGGSAVLLDFWAADFAVGSTHTVDFWITDAAKKVYIDGVLRLSSTDNTLTSGPAGVRLASGNPVSDTQGVHLDNFRVLSLGGIPQPLLEGYI